METTLLMYMILLKTFSYKRFFFLLILTNFDSYKDKQECTSYHPL